MISAGMIAAGHGSRLQDAFPETIKPLVPLGGKPLINWPVRFLAEAGIASLTVLFNSKGTPAGKFLEESFGSLDLSIYYKDTGSSYESFQLVSRKLAERSTAFLITTVDALIPPAELAGFVETAVSSRAEAALGLTSFVEDEKPLWADLDDDNRVVRLGTKAVDRRWATSGLYFLTADLASKLPAPDGRPLREHLGNLVDSGRRVVGVPMAKTIDVDRPEDFSEAEKFVQRYQ